MMAEDLGEQPPTPTRAKEAIRWCCFLLMEMLMPGKGMKSGDDLTKFLLDW